MKPGQINQYLFEDCPSGDITSQAIFGQKSKTVVAEIRAKEALVVSGFGVIKNLVAQKFKDLKLKIIKKDGTPVRKGMVLAQLKGPVIDLLILERLCLNFLQHLSGIATLTSEFVKQAKPHKVKILDTRKTIPGLRLEEKQAVKDGGGNNHRMGLSDQYLIKDNHIDAAGSVTEAINLVLGHKKHLKLKQKIEIEVRNQAEFMEALALRPNIILLDNMTPNLIKKLVLLRNQAGLKKSVLLEISGGVTLRNVKAYAKLGVDRISVGALTHSARAVDISLKVKT